MKKLTAITICLLFIFIGEIFPQTYGETEDAGYIEEIYGDTVQVQGNLGLHIFEMISPCSWCERQIPVLINFESLSRATMRPEYNPLRTSPINMFIIRDGREGNH